MSLYEPAALLAHAAGEYAPLNPDAAGRRCPECGAEIDHYNRSRLDDCERCDDCYVALVERAGAHCCEECGIATDAIGDACVCYGGCGNSHALDESELERMASGTIAEFVAEARANGGAK